MDRLKLTLVAPGLLLLCLVALGRELPLPEARDNPGDGGGAIVVTWNPVEDGALIGYDVERQAEGDTWVRVGFRGPLAARLVDDEVTDGTRYQYRLAALYPDTVLHSEPTATVTSSPQWFDPTTLTALIGTLIFTFLLLFFTFQARSGRKLFIRRIGGLDAVEEALGRATEMGRATLFVPGLSTVDDIATIAALNILSEVAKRTAQFQTQLIVPTADPIVFTVAQEIVKESYTSAGRPDAYDPGMVFFLTNEQFAYAAGVDGIMVREKPATNFLVGYFWAESLILAETGASTGAVQIAGTDAIGQLPFFITACDYTLIGEELYAASAYLSREPLLMGAIKGQDWSKLLIMALIFLGTLLALAFGIATPDLF
ncbi:fibronectin type III domain-containing protein [candidate division WOR-3 bacterium]|nr:fibronectin type III domain-containing protein [candidate division WOR-3 bacterium]